MFLVGSSKPSTGHTAAWSRFLATHVRKQRPSQQHKSVFSTLLSQAETTFFFDEEIGDTIRYSIIRLTTGLLETKTTCSLFICVFASHFTTWWQTILDDWMTSFNCTRQTQVIYELCTAHKRTWTSPFNSDRPVSTKDRPLLSLTDDTDVKRRGEDFSGLPHMLINIVAPTSASKRVIIVIGKLRMRT